MKNKSKMMNMKKLSSSFLTSFCISLSLSSIVIFLHQVMDYNVPLFPLFLLSLILLLFPDFRFLFSKRQVHLLFFSMTFILYILPFLLIPFIDGNKLLTFYSDLFSEAVQTLKGETTISRVAFQGVVICLFLCSGLLIKTLLLRFGKVTGFLLLGLQLTVLISVFILDRLPGLLPLALIFFTILLNLMFFFYRNKVCLKETRDQIIFFLQSFFYGIVFSLILCTAFLNNSDPMGFLRIFSINDISINLSRLNNSDTDKGTVLFDEENGILDLTSSYPNKKGTALILLSSKPIYLKSHTLNSYTGREWKSSKLETPVFDPMIESLLLNRSRDYFNPEKPVEIVYKDIITNSKIVPLFTFRTEDLSVTAAPPYGKGTRYKAFHFTPSDFFWNELNLGSSSEVLSNAMTDTMTDEISESIVDLAARITKNSDGAYSKARYLEDYLKHNYLYTTAPPEPPTDGDLTEFFLMESKEGFCIHFASALALLCRSVNIPSRIAIGYVARNGRERDINIKNNDKRLLFSVSHTEAHAWTEVYIAPFGWIPMDGTPRYSSVYDSYLNDEEFIIQKKKTEQLEVKERINILLLILIFCFTLIISCPLIAALINKILYITPRQKAKQYYIRFIRLLKLYHYNYRASRTLREISEEFTREDNPESIQKFLKKMEEMIYKDNDFSIENLAILKKLYKQTQYFFFKKGKNPLFFLYKFLGLL